MNDLQPSDVPPTDPVLAASDNPSPTPTPTDVPPTATIADVPATTDVPAQPSDTPDHSPQLSDPPVTPTPVQNLPPGSILSPSQTPSPLLEQSASNAGNIVSLPASSDLLSLSTIEYGPWSPSPQPTHTDYFVPSSALK